MNIIFIDMDGVLSNFDAYYFKNRKEFIYEEFRNEVLHNKLYTRLPPMFNMSRFVTRVVSLAIENNYKVEILSSTHTMKRAQLNESAKQKREWLDNNGLSNYKLNAVRKRSEKGDYAKEGNIIIDDQIECVEYFKEQGGKGVVYQGPDKTIEDLITVLNGKEVEIPKNLKNQF